MSPTFFDHRLKDSITGMFPFQGARLLGYVSALTMTRVTTGRLMSVSGSIPPKVGFCLWVCAAQTVDSRNPAILWILLFRPRLQPYCLVDGPIILVACKPHPLDREGFLTTLCIAHASPLCPSSHFPSIAFALIVNASHVIQNGTSCFSP